MKILFNNYLAKEKQAELIKELENLVDSINIINQSSKYGERKLNIDQIEEHIIKPFQ